MNANIYYRLSTIAYFATFTVTYYVYMYTHTHHSLSVINIKLSHIMQCRDKNLPDTWNCEADKQIHRMMVWRWMMGAWDVSKIRIGILH